MVMNMSSPWVGVPGLSEELVEFDSVIVHGTSFFDFLTSHNNNTVSSQDLMSNNAAESSEKVSSGVNDDILHD